MLSLRALFWTTVMPGMVAGYIPWRYFDVRDARLKWSDPADLSGLLMAGAGTLLLIACVVEFARRGKGTLSPVDPPKHLVIQGLYRYVRNPMYIGVTLILLGEALLIRSRELAIYWALFFTLANLFVIVYEEPYLHRHFGAEYGDYTRRVGRWLPRFSGRR